MKLFSSEYDHKRRSFLKLSALLGLGMTSAAFLPIEKAESVLFRRNEYKISRTQRAMGTFVAMTVIHDSRDQAENALGLAFAEVDRLCALFTRFGNQSPVCELNAENRLHHLDNEFSEVLGRSLAFHRATNGAFDITVKPLIDLYQNHFLAGKQPSEAEIEATITRIGTDRLRFTNGSLFLPDPGMGITFDGVAPGYITDRAAHVLAENGIDNYLVNGGGEITVGGHAAKGEAWTVAIQDPNKKQEYPCTINLREGAVSTSGNYEMYYDREKIFHHIVNAKSGHSPLQATSVTVKAPTAMDADILSTAVFVMEPSEGRNFINAQPGYECFIMDREGRTIQSSGWPV